jgi:hypothetical protein
MLYLEMLASREEQIRETRRQVERNRIEARLSRARSGTDAALSVTLPHMSLFTIPAWSVRSWRGAGW